MPDTEVRSNTVSVYGDPKGVTLTWSELCVELERLANKHNVRISFTTSDEHVPLIA